MSFGQPLWFWGFAFLPLLIVLYARNESRRGKLLQKLVAARLQGRLAGTVSLGLRRLRFTLFLLGLAALLVSLAEPRYGYTWEQSKRQGRDILIAIDCSRSMLATDLAPSRLGRAKLATQDLIAQLQGDRVGLIAFEGTAFLQAPLTIDYSAVLDSLAELDTNIIPRGGTNIAAAITEADAAFGKGESDNRCLIIFTDGEELESDAVAAAAAEKDHMRIFTVGLGSADGSLIPVPGENGGTDFVKDENGQIVKSRLDEDRLRKIAESTGGFYVHLQNGPAEMKQIIQDGLGKMKEKDIDARMSRRPIERYEWPLSAALVLLVASALIGERKRSTRRMGPPSSPRAEPPPLPRVAALLLLLLLPLVAQAKNSGLEAYEQKDYKGAMSEFDRQLQQRKDSAALSFDLGAAAYKAGDLGKALEAFAKAVTSPDPRLRAAAEYNLGNTLFEQGQATQQKDNRVRAWKDALEHYEQALKVTPGNKDAEYNRDLVRRLLEEMEKQPPKQDQQQQQQNKKDDQKKDQQNQQQQQQNKGAQNKDQKDQQQQQQKSGGSQDQDKNQQQNSQQQSQSQQQQQSQSQQSQGSSGQQQQPQNQPGNAPQDKDQQNGKDGQQNQQPQPQEGGKGEQKKDSPSNPSQGNPQSPQQNQDGQGEQPKLAPDESGKKREGEIQAGNAQQGAEKSDPQQEAAAEAQAAQEGKMTPAQAKTLLESLKGEDERVQLLKPTGKPHGHNFRDW